MTYGVLFHTIDTTMQFEMWRGIIDYAKDHGIHLVSYIGTSKLTHAYGLISHLDTCFDMMGNSKNLDGLILLSGFFTDQAETQGKFYHYVSLLPIFDMDVLGGELHRLLPEFSIDTALVGLYKNPIPIGTENADRTIGNLIGFDGDTRFNMKHNSWNPICFSDYSTIDSFNFDRKLRTLLFYPLFFKDEELGAILLPYHPEITTDVYETLRINIATALKGAELLTKIQTLSVTDELTGLLNRRGFFQQVYARLELLKKDNELVTTVMFVDLDDLKIINDTCGHKEGDNALASFANVLKESLRGEDIIGRMGGDEFVVLSSIKAKRTISHVVARLRDKLAEYNAGNPHPYALECSMGSVVLDEATKECFEAAISKADSVLYEEKMRKKGNINR